MWFLVAVRVVRRNDLGVGGKILWIVVILVIPIVGLFVYFLWDAAQAANDVARTDETEGQGFEPWKSLHP